MTDGKQVKTQHYDGDSVASEFFVISLMVNGRVSCKLDDAWLLTKWPGVHDAVKAGLPRSEREQYVLCRCDAPHTPRAVLLQ